MVKVKVEEISVSVADASLATRVSAYIAGIPHWYAIGSRILRHAFCIPIYVEEVLDADASPATRVSAYIAVIPHWYAIGSRILGSIS